MLKPEPEQLSLEEIVIIPSARSSKSEIGY
jgi:hypothetical protein